jgi:hypothetical protein
LLKLSYSPWFLPRHLVVVRVGLVEIGGTKVI